MRQSLHADFTEPYPVVVCSCCRHRFYRFEEIHSHVIGIFYGLGDVKYSVAWNCPKCDSTQSVLWAEASEEVRRIGENIELLAAMIAAEMPAAGMEEAA